MFDLKDKIILVVGGRGYLGRDFCQALRSQNASVISADLPIQSQAASKSEFNNEFSDIVAYLQVKDLDSKDNNQVFLFNGWTFVSSPTLEPIDHPIYDLWITGCDNI